LDQPYDIKLVFVQKITLILFLGKSTKTAATRAALFDQYAPNRLSAGVSPQTPLGELTALPKDPLAVFRGPTSKARGGTGGNGKRRGGEGEERRRGRGEINDRRVDKRTAGERRGWRGRVRRRMDGGRFSSFA